MTNKPLVYEHDLGNGSILNVYSIDSSIDLESLKKTVESNLLKTKRKSQVNLDELVKRIPIVGEVNNFSELEICASFDRYEIPKQLLPYRDAIRLKFSDPIAIYRDDVRIPLKLIKGEYRDFVSTHLKAVPGDLVPDKYPKDKTIAELLLEWNLDYKSVARLLGFAHVMTPKNGEEISFVYKNREVHIAQDCMAFSGSTPKFPEQFNWNGFSYDDYYRRHLDEEMKEEYCLKSEKFKVGKIYLIEDIAEVPSVSVEIVTNYSTKELAEIAFGNSEAIKEHRIFFSTNRESLKALLEQVDFFPHTARVLEKYK